MEERRRVIMAVKLRLKRIGAKKRPFYRVIVSDSREKRDGNFIELIGTFSPLNEKKYEIDETLALKWLKTGAIPTDTVKNIFSELGIMKKFHEEKSKK
jgi:small subunit ribosomal protein S16